MRARLFSWALIVLFAATSVAAQQGTSEMRGRVIDAQGGVLPGVSVTVTNQANGMFRQTVSGEDGSVVVLPEWLGGTPWEAVPGRPIDGLGISREQIDGAILYRLV